MSAEVSLLTNDTGLRMKLRSRSIPAVRPRDEDRLTDEPDETELELVRARKELQRLQARQPILQLGFEDFTNYRTVDLPRIDESPRPKAHPTWFFGHSEDGMKDYDDKYQAYLGLFRDWRSEVERMFSCEPVLRNVGSAEATNVSIEINFPGGVTLLKSSPKKPKPPRHVMDLGTFDPADIALYARVPEMSPLQPSFDRTSAMVKWNIPSLVHNRRSSLRPFLVRFEAEPRSFQANFTVGCREVIDLTEGALNFKMKQ
jgi:hypothetical protein